MRKRFDRFADSRRCSAIFLLSVAFLFTNCSMFSKRRRPVGDQTTSMDGGTVPRAQYEDLLRKYEILLKEMRKKDDLQKAQVLTDYSTPENKGDNTPKTELTETVHLGGEGGENATNLVLDPSTEFPAEGLEQKGLDAMTGDQKTEEEIWRLKKARSLLQVGDLGGALKIFQQLENSSSRQVSVRAKFGTGEVLVKQNEYDLAMQVFEEILQKYAYSGMILPTLRYLIDCSGRLRLEQKREKYISLLRDIFGEES